MMACTRHQSTICVCPLGGANHCAAARSSAGHVVGTRARAMRAMVSARYRRGAAVGGWEGTCCCMGGFKPGAVK